LDGLNLNPMLDVSRVMDSRKKVTRANAEDQFLELLCLEMVDKMLPSNKKSFIKSSVDQDFAKRLFAQKLSKQIKKQGGFDSLKNINYESEVNKKLIQ